MYQNVLIKRVSTFKNSQLYNHTKDTFFLNWLSRLVDQSFDDDMATDATPISTPLDNVPL